MKFKVQVFSFYFYLFFKKTALYMAVEKNNIDIIKILLDDPRIDVNSKSI